MLWVVVLGPELALLESCWMGLHVSVPAVLSLQFAFLLIMAYCEGKNSWGRIVGFENMRDMIHKFGVGSR